MFSIVKIYVIIYVTLVTVFVILVIISIILVTNFVTLVTETVIKKKYKSLMKRKKKSWYILFIQKCFLTKK